MSPTFDGQTTGDIPCNATAAQVQAALESLSSIGQGGVVVTGGGGSTGMAMQMKTPILLNARGNLFNSGRTAGSSNGKGQETVAGIGSMAMTR